MVMGGGIAGIHAALSLSGAGYGVHLVERKASLGGMIPDLHRIYPLCACCKMNPKIAACEQDQNINVMLETTVETISGGLGDFTVSLNTATGTKEVKAGAIVLAAGIETFDPEAFETYSYGNRPNVITSVEYEQLQKPLGPNQGTIKRPSDGKTPGKIAWLQCVGSRDINLCDAPYCSSVCCMYALKEAVNTKDFDEDIETTIFYMDMRTHGKGFEDYLNAAVERDVQLIRSRIHTVDAVAGSDDLAIMYADERGELKQETFDMVVLSVGLKPSDEAIDLARKTGIDLNEDEFIGTGHFRPVSTNKPGIFVCGGLSGPFDIGQSITQAAASVSEIAACLDPEPMSPPRAYPKPSKATGKKPKVFLAYHLCAGMSPELGAEIEKYAEKLPGVVSVSRVEGDMIAALVDGLKENGANRLVFVSCTPLTHKALLEDALKLAGLNPYVYETVDLRVLDPQSAATQLRDRLRMGVSRAAFITPPSIRQVPVVKSALVVGGGVAGLESSLAIAEAGFKVTLVEKDKKLGGHGRHVRTTWQGYGVQEYLKGLISSVKQNEKITLLTQTTVEENRGFAGKFVTTLDKKGKNKSVSHGAVVLAPGGDSIRPVEYLYGENKNVYLWSELSTKMIEDPSPFEKADTAVFIQCVGSREPDRTHCSNFCCSFAVRNAVDLKTKNPNMDIYIIYREMRTFGERESLYREARDKGIVFIRYDVNNKPIVESPGKGDRLKVTVFDPILERPLNLEADFISLQTAIVGTNNKELAGIFRVNLDQDGFLSESPEKLRPVDTSIKGVYMAGLAVYPKDTADSIVQAKAASGRAIEILSQDTVQVGGMVAEVMPEKCAVCCTCVRTCPFNVPVIDHEKGAAFIDPALCQGCGMCVAECPGKAIVMSTCSDEMLTEAPSLLLNVDY
jgi:heterodisulfide reductase subunit A